MKRRLLSILVLNMIALGTISIYGQSKTSLKTESDSTSYVYGLAMSQGFMEHMIGSGLLIDMNGIEAEYDFRISTAEGAEKAKLEKEFAHKLDSAKTANDKSLNEFFTGFTEVMDATSPREAYWLGTNVAGQVLKSSDQFSEELLGGKGHFNKKAFTHAFASAIKGSEPMLSVENPQEVLGEKAQKRMEQKNEEVKIAAEKAAAEKKAKYASKIEKEAKFLAANKKKKGIVALESGLQYRVVKQGTGKTPGDNDVVNVHYEGKTLDDNIFDSSYERNEAITLSVSHVIKGWTEALKLMAEGSEWEIFVPYDLAYGDRDQGDIEPFSTLKFRIELLEVVSVEELEKAYKEEE